MRFKTIRRLMSRTTSLDAAWVTVLRRFTTRLSSYIHCKPDLFLNAKNVCGFNMVFHGSRESLSASGFGFEIWQHGSVEPLWDDHRSVSAAPPPFARCVGFML